MPASVRARSSGSPFSCISSMKSNSTMTWLTMTPIASYSKKCHEAKRRAHDCQSDQCADRPIGSGREDQQGLYGVIELNQQRQVDADQRNEKNDSEIRESVNLLRLFPADL